MLSELNQKILSLMTERSMTQEELAIAIHVTQSFLSRLLRGQRAWKKYLLQRVVDHFKISLSDLIPTEKVEDQLITEVHQTQVVSAEIQRENEILKLEVSSLKETISELQKDLQEIQKELEKRPTVEIVPLLEQERILLLSRVKILEETIENYSTVNKLLIEKQVQVTRLQFELKEMTHAYKSSQRFLHATLVREQTKQQALQKERKKKSEAIQTLSLAKK